MDTEQEVNGLPSYTCATCQDKGTVLFTNPDGSQVEGPCPTHITAEITQPPQAEAIPTETPQEQAAPPVVETQQQAIETTPEEKPLEGEVVEKHAGGRPTKYNEEMLAKAQEYINSCWETKSKDKSGKEIRTPRMPFIEELALELGVDDTTVNSWSSIDENGQPIYPEFLATIKRIKMLQKLTLQKRTLGKANPTGAIFLLKANHNMIETEKKILAGESNAPLTIEIIEEQGKKQLMEEATT